MEVTPHSALCRVLVGRDAERDALRQAVERSQQGSAQAILLGGEAGIGKSRLLREAKAAAAVRGFLTLQGNCFQPDIACPYAPLLDLLHSHITRDGPAALTSKSLAPFARELLPLVPDLLPMLDPVPPLPALDPEQEKRRLFAALAEVLLAQSADQPLLLVFEDVHWSDDTSLEFLAYLIRRCAEHRVLLLMTYRNDAFGARLRHWLAQLDRERMVQEVILHPLTLAGIDAMVRSILELDRPVRPEFLDPIYALVEGNPFVLEEVLRSLIATGDIFFAEGRWERKPMGELRIPRSVEDAVQVRLEQLSPLGRRVLQLAAVAGRRFDFALLRQLSDLAEDALLAQLKELVAAQLVIEESAEHFAFRHALTRQTIYAGLLTRERQTLHRTIATTLEQMYPHALDAHVGDLAAHYFEAGEWSPALAYAQRAGVKAQALYAPQAAAEHMTHALEAAAKLGVPAPVEAFGVRGQAFELLGNFERARVDFEDALAAAREADDRRAEWQALIDLGMLWSGRDYVRTGEYFKLAFALASELQDPRLRAHSLNRVGNWHSNRDESAEALRFHEQALTIFEGLDDQHGIAQTLDLLGMANLMATDLVTGKAYYDRSVALFRTAGDRQGLSSSLAARSLASPTYQTDSSVSASATLPEAADACETAARVALEIGYRAGESFALWILGASLGPQGEYGRALHAAQKAVEIADEIEHRQWQAAARCMLGSIYADLFAFSEAEQTLNDALRFARETGSLHWIRSATGLLVSACAARGDAARAQSLLDEVLITALPMRTIGQRHVWCGRVSLALLRGDVQAASRDIEAMIAAAPNADAGPPILLLSRLRGEALAALHRLPEAEAALRAALDTATTYSARSSAWRIQLALAKLYRAQRQPDAAAQSLAAARTLVAVCTATIPEGDLRAKFVAATSALLPEPPAMSPRRAAREAFGGLTAREREVAALVTTGQSNHAIAATLVVSERTVETHVSSILLKLGFSSRAQIAAWAVEKGLARNASQV